MVPHHGRNRAASAPARAGVRQAARAHSRRLAAGGRRRAAAPTFELIPQEPSPRSPESASLWRLGDLCDVGEPLRQGDQVRRGLVRRRPSGRELLLVGLPCCGPFAPRAVDPAIARSARRRSAARLPFSRSLSAFKWRRARAAHSQVQSLGVCGAVRAAVQRPYVQHLR
jgi:hypothetical protein